MLLDLFRNTIGQIQYDETGFRVERRARLWERTSHYQVEWTAITDVWALREIDDTGSTLFLRVLAGDQDVTISDRDAGWLELCRAMPNHLDGFPSLRGWLPRIYQRPRAHAAIPVYERERNVIEFPKTAAAHA